MASGDNLTSQLDAEFPTTPERIGGMQAEASRISGKTQTQFQVFTRLRDRINNLTAPRLKQLQERLPGADTTPVPSPHGDSVTLRLVSNVARITVEFSLSHDGPVGNAFLDYNVEILPVFIRFDRASAHFGQSGQAGARTDCSVYRPP